MGELGWAGTTARPGFLCGVAHSREDSELLGDFVIRLVFALQS
jgi:hypothetical protein